MSDRKYFTTTKKGVIRELQDDLNSVDKKKIKEAVKKVIAMMAVGKDVGMLFSDVIKSMGSDNIELKKLVYLYIINYARSQPEKAILVVGMFQKDATNNPNPLLRALALRTMASVRVERITEYLTDPVNIALKDEDAYVRKTAVIAVAKLYSINPELAEERGLIYQLREMLSDPNPMVVANTVAALTDISDASGVDHFKIDSSILSKLLTALTECTEWGRVFILDALSKFKPSTDEQISAICERVLPQLRHNNSAVVMTSVKIIIKLMQLIEQNKDDNKDDNNKVNLYHRYCKELVSPLMTLLSSRPEIQYVTLKNIDLIVQKYPKLFANHSRMFAVKFNDEVWIKNQKLEILKKLATSENHTFILSEFEQYAQEVDIDFVRRSVRSIGYIAMKLECAAAKCVKILSDLVKTGINYVVEESVIVIRDIFRRYPNSYEKLIVTICDNLESLNNAEAKGSFIWIIGEYAERIVDADERLEYFIDSFESEECMVQLQLLTATVKLFLKKPDKTKGLVQKVLKLATEASDNPDLRDRGYVYWRLLSTDPTVARKVVLAQRPTISCKSFKLPEDQLSNLLNNISTLSSVYHQPPNNFASDYGTSFEHYISDDESDSSSYTSSSSSEESSDGDESEAIPTQTPISLDSVQMQTAIDSKDEGLVMRVGYKTGKKMIIQCFNKGNDIIKKIDLKINKNYLGIQPSVDMVPLSGDMIKPGKSQIVEVGLILSSGYVIQNCSNIQVQMAARIHSINSSTNNGNPPKIHLFNSQISVWTFCKSPTISRDSYQSKWREISQKNDRQQVFNTPKDKTNDSMREILEKNSFVLVANRVIENKGVSLYLATELNGNTILLEFSIAIIGKCRIIIRSKNNYLSDIVCLAVKSLILEEKNK